MQQLVNFYDPYIQGENVDERTLDYILSQSDDWLEVTHNYIQWLFPLPTATPNNKTAPILNPITMRYMGEHDRFRQQIRLSLIRMMWFWGFMTMYNPGDKEPFQVVGPVDNGDIPHKRWLVRRNHNHRRITRAIRSLRFFGMDNEARVIQREFARVNSLYGDVVNKESLNQWVEAATGNLY